MNSIPSTSSSTAYHTNQNNQCCFSDCNKSFDSMDNLGKHIVDIHKPANPYVCTICGKNNTTKAKLN